ncbi:Uncharacterised protein [Bordetella pertussis]|nr:Uncharacterised protein [Bordetella pertussis]
MPSMVMSRRTCSSVSNTVSPLRVFNVTGTIWSRKRPASMAAAARRCDSTASASWSARLME